MDSHENNKGKGNSNITADQKETTTQGTFLNQRTTQMTMAMPVRSSKPDHPTPPQLLEMVSGTTKKSLPFVDCNFTEAATPIQFSSESTMPPTRPKINLLDLNKVKQMSGGPKRYMMDTITSRTKHLKEGSARNVPQVDQSLEQTNKVAKRKKTKPAKASVIPPRPPQIQEPRSPTALTGYHAFSPLSSGRRHVNKHSFPEDRNCLSPPLGRETLLSPRVKQSIDNIRGKMEKSQITLNQTKQQLAAVTSKEMFLQSLQKSATLCHLAPGDSHWDQLMRPEERPNRKSAKSKIVKSKSQLSLNGEQESDPNSRTQQPGTAQFQQIGGMPSARGMEGQIRTARGDSQQGDQMPR